jgi:hypothetical protein
MVTTDIETIFFAALEKQSPDERARYLQEVCGTDTELRSRIDRMLNAHPKVGEFLESSAMHRHRPL